MHSLTMVQVLIVYINSVLNGETNNVYLPQFTFKNSFSVKLILCFRTNRQFASAVRIFMLRVSFTLKQFIIILKDIPEYNKT